MNRKLLVGAASLLSAGLILAGCQGNTPASNTNSTATTTSTSSSGQTANAVTIKDYSFAPNPLKVKKGTTVTWTNQDTAKHNVVTGQEGGPKGPLLGKGETYQFTFNTVGTFNYNCEPHPYMKGVVEVTE